MSGRGAATTAMGMTREVVLSIVDNEVTRQLAKWGAAFFEDQRKSTAALSSRVEVVVDAFATSCPPDHDDDVDFIEMPSHQAKMLDKLRKDRPELYALLSQRATGVVKGSPLERKGLVRAAIQDVIAAAGGPGV